VIGIESCLSAGYNTAPHTHGWPSDALQALGFNVTKTWGCNDPSGRREKCTQYNSSAVEAAAKAASVVILFIGRGGDEGEKRDNENMTLPGQQKQMVLDAVGSGTPVVLVLLSCNPLDLAFAVESAAVVAILHAYYPQSWGATATARVLSGEVSPAGRMPYSWPRNLSQAGEVGNYTMAGTHKTYRYGIADPLFPFGYGLSYSTFSYSALSVTPSVKPCANLSVSVTVSNTGLVDSDEVVQVYAKWGPQSLPDTLSAPSLQLVGFERVHVKAGASKAVRIDIQPQQLAMLNSTGAFVPSGGHHQDIDCNTTEGCKCWFHGSLDGYIEGKLLDVAGVVFDRLPPFPRCHNATDGGHGIEYSGLSPTIKPCDGNTTGNLCGTLDSGDFSQHPSLGSTIARSKDECCAACRATPASGKKSCVAWTLVGTKVPTPPYDPTEFPLPQWTLVPQSLEVSVGGQQPNQQVSAPSNVLSCLQCPHGISQASGDANPRE
jgi:hypothetical protein